MPCTATVLNFSLDFIMECVLYTEFLISNFSVLYSTVNQECYRDGKQI